MSTFVSGPPETKKSFRVFFTNCNKTVECNPHSNLRQLAIEGDVDLYNGLSRFFNCEGHGLCGTCAVEVVPQEGVTCKRAKENFRPFQLKGNLRLSCQTEVIGDIQVTKHGGIYGTKGYRSMLPRDEIVRFYQEGKTLNEISEYFQCSVARAVVILEKSKVEIRRPGSPV